MRTVNLLIFWPILVRTGHGFSFPMAALTAWSGIRGVVGLVLALYVLVDSSIPHEAYRTQVFFFLATTVVLTVVLQGITYAALAKVDLLHALLKDCRHMCVLATSCLWVSFNTTAASI